MGKTIGTWRLRMDQAEADRIEDQVRSLFPESAIERVQVLGYGDDPEVEPGETAIRVLIASGPPEDDEAAGENLRDFHEANRAAIKRLRHDLPRSIGWIEFRPDRPADPARPHGPILKLRIGGDRGREYPPGEAAEELTPVMTRLGPADLATVDTLITAGIATSRAEVLRWAIGRIRERPAYAQLQQRVHEIDQLKAQF
jgi:hypothetical protein